MTEHAGAAGGSLGTSAGAMLRAARERQGLHIAALAAAIKIPQRKLEALEADRLDELPDATFARALAMTVCRALKIDAAPVLAQLPQVGGKGLSAVAGGLNAPFRDRPGRAEPTDFSPLRHPLSWAALAVLVAAAAVFALPAGWWESFWPAGAPVAAPALPAAASAAASSSAPASAPSAAASDSLSAAPATLGASAAAAPAVEVVHSVPGAEMGASAVADTAGGLAVLRATDATWVEVVDAGGQVLVQRLLQPGESLGLNGTLPFKLKIGNAAATQLQFRGQGVDLAPVTRDNVARLELK
ncbi:MAG: helix-turn-helix domain-containing protein [Burkholderiaceae bacterium]|nr:helix-turn-helix domain-containing protein [Burkholderiaceae bacterium]